MTPYDREAFQQMVKTPAWRLPSAMRAYQANKSLGRGGNSINLPSLGGMNKEDAFSVATNWAYKNMPNLTGSKVFGQGASNTLKTMGDLGLTQAGYNQTGLARYEQDALRSPGSESAWAKIAQGQREQDLGQNLQTAAANQAGANASAWSQMAMRGGLNTGQRERAAFGGANNLMAEQQKLRAASARDAGDIRMQDEQNRMAQLEKLPEMYGAYRDPETMNLQTKLGLLGSNVDLAKTQAQQRGDFLSNVLTGWGTLKGG